MDAATAKAWLQRKEGASSLYEHLTAVLLKLITEQPDGGLAAFEAISSQVKSASFPDQGAGGRPGAAGAAAAEATEAEAATLRALAALFRAPGAAPEGSDAEPTGPGEPVQDLTDEANYLEWAGIGLGRTDMFRLHLALKHLAAKYPAKRLRFWGKILGTRGDYIVAEGVMDPDGEEPEDAKDALGNQIQKTGEGPNKYTYFVCSSIGGSWTRLPNVTPHQIIVARQIRRFFTGALDAAVGGHPPFPGNEANYLRAQIALISSATAASPAGVFVAVDGDEEGDVAPNEEEFDAPDLSSLDGWVHHTLALNTLGRTKPNPPQVNEDGEEVPDADAPEPSAPLKPLAEDEPLTEDAEGGGAWDVRPAQVSGMAEGEAAGVYVLRSLRWPGAVTVGFGKRFTSAYVGYGHEVALRPYAPTLPEALPAEYDQSAEGAALKEQPDVTADPDEGKEAEEGDGEGGDE